MTGLLFSQTDRSPVFIGKRFNLPERKQVHSRRSQLGPFIPGLQDGLMKRWIWLMVLALGGVVTLQYVASNAPRAGLSFVK